MSQRPRLLFLCQTLPFPPDGGVNIRTYNILRLLARSFDITALCFYRRRRGAGDRDVQKSRAALADLCKVEVFPIPQELSRRRLVWDHIRSLAKRRVYTVHAYESAAYRARLRELLQELTFDLVHMDSLDLSGYLPDVAHLPVVCVHHNVESALLRRRAAVEVQGWRGRYVAHQAELMEKEEKRWCGRIKLNVTVSPDDADRLRALAPDGKVVVVPNGVDTDFFQPQEPAPAGIVFVGGTTWFPNKDALAYFADAILPLIRKRRPEARVHWVGRASEQEQELYRDQHGIQMTGYVDDVRPHIASNACYVVPLRVGGGTRLKILDAWAMGMAIVSTSVGCEGLATADGENILVRDAPEAFAHAVIEVLDDRTLQRKLGSGGRRTAEEIYSWDVIGESMKELYLGVVEGRGCGAGQADATLAGS